jgi:peroxiredoxin
MCERDNEGVKQPYFDRRQMMEKKLMFVLVALVLLPMVGCAKSDTAPTTAARTSEPANGADTQPSATDTPAARTDTEVVQAAATIEQPEQPSGQIGATAPAWENLAGTDGKQHSLKDLADAKAIAVVFTCNTCPVAIDYEERLVALAKDYEDKGVALIAINVNNNEGNQLPAMKTRAEEKGFNFAYLYDPSQQIARDYGATVTPHAYLLDWQRKIVYEGAIDDNQDASAATKHYLRDAIDATLASQPIATASTEQFGCGIQYE